MFHSQNIHSLNSNREESHSEEISPTPRVIVRNRLSIHKQTSALSLLPIFTLLCLKYRCFGPRKGKKVKNMYQMGIDPTACSVFTKHPFLELRKYLQHRVIVKSSFHLPSINKHRRSHFFRFLPCYVSNIDVSDPEREKK